MNGKIEIYKHNEYKKYSQYELIESYIQLCKQYNRLIDQLEKVEENYFNIQTQLDRQNEYMFNWKLDLDRPWIGPF